MLVFSLSICHNMNIQGTATGILFALGTFAEIFMFLIAGHLLARYSLKLLMVVCLMLTALRWLLMAYYIDFVIVVILTQIIHAVSFGLMHSSSIHFVRRYFPKRMQNQGQFMYLGITFGIGGALGAWVTGMTWNEGLGGSDTFVWASMVVLVAGLVILMTPRKNFNLNLTKSKYNSHFELKLNFVSEDEPVKEYADLIAIFEQTFFAKYNTKLVLGGSEPIYLPANTSDLGLDAQPYAQVVFAHGYFTSALHEIAHWCLAGMPRLNKIDYGYWYCPDGRTAEQQAKFQQAEVKPQAIEMAFSLSLWH
ncbi:elongation factor P hydroxylase [Psychrosphaera algicola]|uniref:Elongation factor P hydroxylase n=1 Tax=Psychrosphaera algicola TaxID=3023714 RepID=A0ABT5FI70_9GAMM|nr:elongation factor P hydroxylase [Psychrosphaera sp. G1-22]MDC2890890.1 elongation factor P hydroxylase [Psychrosphaera sp. G1-22]